LLLVPTLVLGWFHHSFFPFVVEGARVIFDGKPNLPEGFELAVRFGCCIYLVPLLVLTVCLLSLKLHLLRSPLWLSLCSGLIAMICILYCFLLVTPILSHGVYLGK